MNKDWKMEITRQANGYVIITDDGDSEAGEQCYVYEDGAFDPLISHEHVLHAVMDFFSMYGSKWDIQRLRVIREKGDESRE